MIQIGGQTHMVYKRIIVPLFSLLAFSACSQTGEGPSSEPAAQSSSESLPLEESSSGQPSQSQSSSELSESISDGKVYYTVSFYQSYLRRADAMGRNGLRFDTSLQIEAGTALYRTTEEGRAFYHNNLHPLYQPHGQSYDIIYLFHDAECTDLYVHGDPILSDSTFYYFGEG
ncbi:MAG: hypothetical protein V3G53_04320 [Candidatus Enteromonas sp.]